MANINLLPWREERRARLQKEFLIVLLLAASLGVGAVFAVDFLVQKQISYQLERNKIIEQQTAGLDRRIKEINTLKSQRTRLIERMDVIQDLQGDRSIVVHYFDELVRTIPDGVYFQSVERSGDKFFIRGIAEANNRVSNLMRRLDESPWFKNPNLTEVKALGGPNDNNASSQFVLSVQAARPEEDM